MDHASQVAEIRAFNRFYTRIIGLLDEGLHQSPFSLAEARVVYELGKRGSTSAAILADTLGMDRGQMSRLVWKLMDNGIVATLPRGNDKRSVPLALTAEGDALSRRFNELSDAAAADSLLTPLDAFQRLDLVGAMRRIQSILAEPDGDALLLRPHRVGELGWLTHRQALLYHLEQGWNGEFETLIARLYADFAAAPASTAKSLWVAEQGGEVAGSVFVIPAADEPEGTAQLRLLYVEPAFRGRGIGKRLVDEAVRFAKAAGYRRLMLWTQDSLSSARAIYQAAGFTLLRQEPHHSFGADLTGQYWSLDL